MKKNVRYGSDTSYIISHGGGNDIYSIFDPLEQFDLIMFLGINNSIL
jgi:hypothetical protein